MLKFKLVLGSRKIIEDIPETVDSIFLIKTKNIVRYIPLLNGIGRVKVGYLEETTNSTNPLKRTEKISDKPLRYIITSLSINNDSAKGIIYGINQKIDYRLKL